MKAQDIIKTKNIIRVSPEDTLSSVLSQLSSSHDAALVFSDDKKFLGIINPYHSLIKSSYPGNAKVEHVIFHAPRIKSNQSLEKVAQMMVESKVHYLPVFEQQKEKFLGIVSARHILTLTKDSPAFRNSIEEFLRIKNRPVVTVFEDDLVSYAIHLFRTRKLSKLIVVNKDMKLRGVLAHYDLIQFLVAPKKKGHWGDRKGDRISLQHSLVRNFTKTLVLTLSSIHTLRDALQLVLDKEIGSVIIVDEQRHPIGIITTRDFLGQLTKKSQAQKFEIVAKNLSVESRRIFGGFFNSVVSLSKKIPDLAKVRLFIREEKKGGVFEHVMALIPRKGTPKIIRQQGKNLVRMLSESRAALINMLKKK